MRTFASYSRLVVSAGLALCIHSSLGCSGGIDDTDPDWDDTYEATSPDQRQDVEPRDEPTRPPANPGDNAREGAHSVGGALPPSDDGDFYYSPPPPPPPPPPPRESAIYAEVIYNTTNDDKRDDSIVETFVLGKAGEVIAQGNIPYVKFPDRTSQPHAELTEPL